MAARRYLTNVLFYLSVDAGRLQLSLGYSIARLLCRAPN